MKTVGEILKQARTERGISIASVAARTKIQVRYLLAVEENDFKRLPAAAFVKGFIRNYAKVVGKNPESLLAIFRRDYDQDIRGRIIPRTAGVSEPKWQWTPTLTLIGTVAVLVAVFLSYLVLQFRVLSRPPNLEVTQPNEGQTLTNTNVEVAGQSDTDATVMVNDKPVVISAEGKWQDTVLLPAGKHTLTIKATGRNGKTKTIQRTITISE